MARRPAIMLYKGDWKRDPQLSMCSPATRGIWIDLICDMDDLGNATISGPAKMLARMCRASEEEVIEAFAELKSSNAADIECVDGIYTVTCRRVEKELHISDVRRGAVNNRYKTDTNNPTKEPTNSIHPVEDENEEEVLAVEVVLASKAKADCEGIYSVYPRKVSRRAAFRAIECAFQRVIAGESPLGKLNCDQANKFLHCAVEGYARSPDGMNGKFTPHPATWFNASRYLDDQQEWAKSAAPRGSNGNYKSKTESSIDAACEAIRIIGERAADRDGADEARYTPAGQAGYGGLPRLGSGSGLF